MNDALPCKALERFPDGRRARTQAGRYFPYVDDSARSLITIAQPLKDVSSDALDS
jgi:hypothetical protein